MFFSRALCLLHHAGEKTRHISMRSLGVMTLCLRKIRTRPIGHVIIACIPYISKRNAVILWYQIAYQRSVFLQRGFRRQRQETLFTWEQRLLSLTTKTPLQKRRWQNIIVPVLEFGCMFRSHLTPRYATVFITAQLSDQLIFYSCIIMKAPSSEGRWCVI